MRPRWVEFNQIPMWWYQTVTSTPYLQAAGGIQKNTMHQDNIAQQAAAHMMNQIVRQWTVIVYGMERVDDDLLAQFNQWQSQTVAAIRTGRFRENHLENMAGFKPAVAAAEAVQRANREQVCPYMLCRAALAKGKREEGTQTARKLAEQLLTTPPDLFCAWTNQKEKDTKNIHKAMFDTT